MSKAILVMDMPDNCLDCPLQTEYDTLRCAVTNDVTDMKTYPVWCPLKPMPERIDFEKEFEAEIENDAADEDSDIDKAYFEGRVNGWNACLEEIWGVII